MFWEKQQQERKGDSPFSPLQEGFLEEVDSFGHGTLYGEPTLMRNIMISVVTIPIPVKSLRPGVFRQSQFVCG